MKAQALRRLQSVLGIKSAVGASVSFVQLHGRDAFLSTEMRIGKTADQPNRSHKSMNWMIFMDIVLLLGRSNLISRAAGTQMALPVPLRAMVTCDLA